MDILLVCREDGIEVRQDDGDNRLLGYINRDDDSAEAITKLLNALVIEYRMVDKFSG